MAEPHVFERAAPWYAFPVYVLTVLPYSLAPALLIPRIKDGSLDPLRQVVPLATQVSLIGALVLVYFGSFLAGQLWLQGYVRRRFGRVELGEDAILWRPATMFGRRFEVPYGTVRRWWTSEHAVLIDATVPTRTRLGYWLRYRVLAVPTADDAEQARVLRLLEAATI